MSDSYRMQKFENRKYVINCLLRDAEKLVKHYADGDFGIPQELLNVRSRLHQHLVQCEAEMFGLLERTLHAEVSALFERIEAEDAEDKK